MELFLKIVDFTFVWKIIIISFLLCCVYYLCLICGVCNYAMLIVLVLSYVVLYRAYHLCLCCVVLESTVLYVLWLFCLVLFMEVVCLMWCLVVCFYCFRVCITVP